MMQKSFSLLLHDTTHSMQFDGVISFVGEDNSGSFGIMPNHMRLMTFLVMGLARFSPDGDNWQYIATPGALIYFRDNQLTLSTRRFFIDTDYMRISKTLEMQLFQEEVELQTQKRSLRRMEEELLKRLWQEGHGLL